MKPRIQYAQTEDGVSIAYSTVGSGPALVVLPADCAKAHAGLLADGVFGERAEEGNQTSICRVGPNKDVLRPAQEPRMLSLYETNSPWLFAALAAASPML